MNDKALKSKAVVLFSLLAAGALGLALARGWRQDGRKDVPAAAGPAFERTDPSKASPELPPPRLRPLPADAPAANVSAAVPASSAVRLEERFLAEVVPRAEDCRATCGGRCYQAEDGRLRCARLCSSNEDCPADGFCFPVDQRARRCLVSECAGVGQDDGCEPGRTCLPVSAASGAAFICAPTGDRRAGEECIGMMLGKIPRGMTCGPGLACIDGTCMPAKCDSDAACPRGSRCTKQVGGLIDHGQCVPACDSDPDCPAGEACVPLPPTGRKTCATLAAAACLKEGCPAGQHCEVQFPSRRQLRAACVSSCDPAAPGACPAPQVCRQGVFGRPDQASCVFPCSKEDPTCPPGTTCTPGPAGQFSCRPPVRLNQARPAR